MVTPCGTFSKARENPLPQWMKDQGIKEPQPLRSEKEPWGLGKYSERDDEKRVELANELVAFGIKTTRECIKRGPGKLADLVVAKRGGPPQRGRSHGHLLTGLHAWRHQGQAAEVADGHEEPQGPRSQMRQEPCPRGLGAQKF